MEKMEPISQKPDIKGTFFSYQLTHFSFIYIHSILDNTHVKLSEDDNELSSNKDFVSVKLEDEIRVSSGDNHHFKPLEKPVSSFFKQSPSFFNKEGKPITNDTILQNVNAEVSKQFTVAHLESKYPPSDLIPFLIKLAYSYFRCGAPSNRVENNLTRCSEKMGIYASYICLPSSITITFGAPEILGSVTKFIKINDFTYDCGRMYQIDRLIDKITHRSDYTLYQASEKLEKIIKRPPYFNDITNIFCGAVNAFIAAGLFFNGGWIDMSISFFLGLFLRLLKHYTYKFNNFSDYLSDFLCAILASFVATIFSSYLRNTCYSAITLSSAIFLLPGLSLTIAVVEIESNCFTSGAIRLINSCLIAFKVGFAIAIGSSLAFWIQDKPSMTDLCKNGVHQQWNLLFFPIISVTYNISLDAKLNQWSGMTLTSILGYIIPFLCRIFRIPSGMIPFIASFFIVTASNLISRFSSIPGVVFVFSGILFLVPGSISIKSIMNFFSEDLVAGIEIGFSMIIVALSITFGTILANIFIAPKKKHKNRAF